MECADVRLLHHTPNPYTDVRVTPLAPWLPGKTITEASTRRYAADGKGTSILLQPSFVYGSRYITEAQLPIPIWMVGAPVRAFMDTFKDQVRQQCTLSGVDGLPKNKFKI